ncbi:MAG TPA: hypothetical protein VK395_19990 [Gemmataceae bacterium]|nr:hypothetical protein [Gemmataceae bacterium]
MSKTSSKLDCFQDDEGRTWIWVRHATLKFRLPVSAILYAQDLRCPSLDRTIETNERLVNGRRRRYALEADLAQMRAARARKAPPAQPSADADVIPLREAARVSGYTVAGLKWMLKNGSSAVANRTLWGEKRWQILEDGRRRLTTHVSRAEMEQLREQAKSKPDDPDTVIAGRLTARQAMMKYPVTDAGLRKAHAGGEIDAKKMPVPKRSGRWTTRRYYLEKDVDAYAARLKAPSAIERAREFLAEALADGPKPFHQQILPQAKRHGISEKALRRAKKALKVEATQPADRAPSYWHYRSQKLPEVKPATRSSQAKDKALRFLRATAGYESLSLNQLVEKASGLGISKTTIRRALAAVKSGMAPAAVQPGQPANPPTQQDEARTGRPRSELTLQVQRFCYERYMRNGPGDKLPLIRREAARLFGVRAPKEDSHVTLYAKRYAEKTSSPWSTRNSQNPQ